MTLTTVGQQLAAIAAVVTALAVVGAGVRLAWRTSRRFYRLVDAVIGDESDPDQPGVLASLKHLVEGQRAMRGELCAMRQDLAATQVEFRAHLDGHPPAAVNLRRPGRLR